MQLLEAASVLVAMNVDKEGDTTPPPEFSKDMPSDLDSLSPDPSGYSDQGDRASSADTTPPPTGEAITFGTYRNKRHSSGSGFSRSYQSAPSTNVQLVSSASQGNVFGHHRQPSHERRPGSAGLNKSNEEDRDLAAAVELLSCSFGSSNGNVGASAGHQTVTLPADAPPVPPVPAQYLEQAKSLTNSCFINNFPSRPPESFTRGELRRGSQDHDGGLDSTDRMDDSDHVGFFGRMEE